MRTFIITAAVITAVFFVAPQAQSQVNIGVSVGTGDRDGFYLDIGNYYRVPEREVVVVRDRHIRDEEIPVVFYFAQCAHVGPAVIIDLRNDGYTWMDIALRYRLSPALFYDPAYGRPYGYHGYWSGRVWGRTRLADDDFIRFCNVRFLAERYHYRPDNILRMRERQHDFYMIHNDIRHEMEHRGGPVTNHERMDRDNHGHDGGDRHDNGRHNGDDSRRENRRHSGSGRE